MSKELEEEENHLKQCIEKLKVVEANRLALVSQLRDALNDQVLIKKHLICYHIFHVGNNCSLITFCCYFLYHQVSDLENVRTQMQVRILTFICLALLLCLSLQHQSLALACQQCN